MCDNMGTNLNVLAHVSAHMVVIGHHRIGADIDGKDLAEWEHALLAPLPAVLVA